MPWFVFSVRERETVSCKYRAAPDMATTDNGEILLSGHKVEREAVLIVIRRNKWGQLGENLGGVKFP